MKNKFKNASINPRKQLKPIIAWSELTSVEFGAREFQAYDPNRLLSSIVDHLRKKQDTDFVTSAPIADPPRTEGKIGIYIGSWIGTEWINDNINTKDGNSMYVLNTWKSFESAITNIIMTYARIRPQRDRYFTDNSGKLLIKGNTPLVPDDDILAFFHNLQNLDKWVSEYGSSLTVVNGTIPVIQPSLNMLSELYCNMIRSLCSTSNIFCAELNILINQLCGEFIKKFGDCISSSTIKDLQSMLYILKLTEYPPAFDDSDLFDEMEDIDHEKEPDEYVHLSVPEDTALYNLSDLSHYLVKRAGTHLEFKSHAKPNTRRRLRSEMSDSKVL